MYLCKYKDIFGKVGKGIHSFRICNIAVVDVVLTIAAAYCIHLVLPNYSFGIILLLLFLLGIVLHRLFCVRTPIDKFLFR
jgi:hypothetical protein